MKTNKSIEKLREQLYQLVGDYYVLTKGKALDAENKELVVIENSSKPFLLVFTEA